MAPPASFSGALAGRAEVCVIAELKRKSPSKGSLNPSLKAAERATEYVTGGAAALSILTEPTEFGGSLEDLAEVRQRVVVPLLRKDFHVDESQVWEGRVAGASAILLIARALEPARLEALCGVVFEAGLEPLVEVRSRQELEAAVRLGAPLIGVNARDLETLAIDPAVLDALLPEIPDGRIAIAESGVRSATDVVRAARCGADAVLVGSALSAATDGAGAVRALATVRRQGRAA